MTTIPDDFVQYLESGGPREAFTSDEPGYFSLWKLEEIPKNNLEAEVAEFAPGFIGVGTNGGGELIAFDCSGEVFLIPMVGMDPEDAERIASNWQEVVLRIETQ